MVLGHLAKSALEWRRAAGGGNRTCRHRDGDFAKQRNVMSNLQRRLKKLETLVTDDTGLVPGSPRWLAYWTERLEKFIARDDDAKDHKIPLAVIRAYIQAAEPDSDQGSHSGLPRSTGT